MIRAMVFDLDGTLVKTERLKAISYAKATVDLCPYTVEETEVIDAFRDAVGLSRREVALTLIERFDLHDQAAQQAEIIGVREPWQALVQMRLGYYEDLLADPSVLRENQWPHTVALLKEAREWACLTGLATMSHCRQVQRVLDIIGLENFFDFIATRDDVENGKPDPEIYTLVAAQLAVAHDAVLVIEDSVAGVQAAQAAGMHVIAVTTPFTKERIHASGLLPRGFVVDEPDGVIERVTRLLREWNHE